MKGNAGASIPAIAVPIAAIATHNADANLPKVDTIPVNAPLIPLVAPAPPLAPPRGGQAGGGKKKGGG